MHALHSSFPSAARVSLALGCGAARGSNGERGGSCCGVGVACGCVGGGGAAMGGGKLNTKGIGVGGITCARNAASSKSMALGGAGVGAAVSSGRLPGIAASTVLKRFIRSSAVMTSVSMSMSMSMRRATATGDCGSCRPGADAGDARQILGQAPPFAVEIPPHRNIPGSGLYVKAKAAIRVVIIIELASRQMPSQRAARLNATLQLQAWQRARVDSLLILLHRGLHKRPPLKAQVGSFLNLLQCREARDGRGKQA